MSRKQHSVAENEKAERYSQDRLLVRYGSWDAVFSANLTGGFGMGRRTVNSLLLHFGSELSMDGLTFRLALTHVARLLHVFKGLLHGWPRVIHVFCYEWVWFTGAKRLYTVGNVLKEIKHEDNTQTTTKAKESGCILLIGTSIEICLTCVGGAD